MRRWNRYCLQSQRYQIRLFRSIKISNAHAYPRTFYLCGLVNEKLGNEQEAIEAYTKFLDIWKNADDDLPEKIAAQKRLVTLLN